MNFHEINLYGIQSASLKTMNRYSSMARFLMSAVLGLILLAFTNLSAAQAKASYDADGVEIPEDVQRLIGKSVKARVSSPERPAGVTARYPDISGWRIYEKYFSENFSRSTLRKPRPQVSRPMINEDGHVGPDGGEGHGYYLEHGAKYYPRLFVAAKSDQEVLLGTKYYVEKGDDFYIASVLLISKEEYPVMTVRRGQGLANIAWNRNYALIDVKYLSACLHRGKQVFPLPTDITRSYKLTSAGLIEKNTEKDLLVVNNYPNCGVKKND